MGGWTNGRLFGQRAEWKEGRPPPGCPMLVGLGPAHEKWGRAVPGPVSSCIFSSEAEAPAKPGGHWPQDLCCLTLTCAATSGSFSRLLSWQWLPWRELAGGWTRWPPSGCLSRQLPGPKPLGRRGPQGVGPEEPLTEDTSLLRLASTAS